MASRSNPYARDPALAQAFNNIASMFGPPSGADAAGFSAAAVNRQKAEQLKWLFENANDPLASARSAVTGIQNYGATPTGFMQTDATTRRGQDVTAGTQRENNIRDNARQMAVTRYGPLSEGQVLPPMPASVAGMYALPAQEQPIAGTMKLGQGQDAVLPDGQRIEGPRKPLNESEVKGQERVDLRNRGVLNDQTLLETIVGDKAPVTVIGPDGKTPVYSTPGAAAIKQLPAAAVPSTTPENRKDAVAIIDGKQVAVTRAPSGLQWQLADGTPIPPDAKIMELPKATGSNEQLGLPTTANNTAANNQAAEVSRALSILDIYEELINKNPGAVGIVGAIRGTAQNLAASAGDLAKSFGARAPQIGEAAAALQQGMKGVAPDFFDPAIPEADFLQGTLAYALARTENPSGEVSRQAFERALDRVRGGGLLANTEATRAAISANRKVLQTQLQGIRTLRGQEQARTDAGYREAPAPPKTMQTPATRLRFDANGNQMQ